MRKIVRRCYRDAPVSCIYDIIFRGTKSVGLIGHSCRILKLYITKTHPYNIGSTAIFHGCQNDNFKMKN